MSRARTQADPEAIDRTLDKASIEHYERLAVEADQHLDKLAAQAPLKDTTLEYQLRKRGVTRREFLKMTAVMTATMALPSMFDLRVARAAELATRLPVIWQELQSCTGNSMALIRNTNPGVEELLLDLISLEYAEVLKAPEGRDLRLLVAGHTDNQKIAKKPCREKYPNNFHLSAARALKVADQLRASGVQADRMGVAGFGPHQPIAPNGTPSNRQKNRRVEIFVMAPEVPVVGWTESIPSVY